MLLEEKVGVWALVLGPYPGHSPSMNCRVIKYRGVAYSSLAQAQAIPSFLLGRCYSETVAAPVRSP